MGAKLVTCNQTVTGCSPIPDPRSLIPLYICSMAFSINIPGNFSPQSRVWIYQATRPFTNEEQQAATTAVSSFAESWLSHGEKVKGTGMVMPEGFIILIADIAVTGVSGCSTDSSVRIIKELDSRFNAGLFDRQLLAFLINDEVVRIPMQELSTVITTQQINSSTLYFNNMVQTLDELKTGWLIPAGQSWLSKKLNTAGNPVL